MIDSDQRAILLPVPLPERNIKKHESLRLLPVIKATQTEFSKLMNIGKPKCDETEYA